MRFEKISDGIYDNTTNRKYTENDEICDLLNELVEKIISVENEADLLQMQLNEMKFFLKNIRQIELKR